MKSMACCRHNSTEGLRDPVTLISFSVGLMYVTACNITVCTHTVPLELDNALFEYMILALIHVQ